LVEQIQGETALIDEVFSQCWVPWEAYGIAPTDIDGWSFIRGPLADREVPAGAESDFGLTVLSPVEFTVGGEGVAVAGPPSWRERIRVAESRLVIRLPLVAREGSSILILPPEERLPAHVNAKIAMHTHAHGELEAVWQLDGREDFTVRAGQAVARIVAIAGAVRPETLADNGVFLRVWRVHPQGAHICPAEKTLRGDASSAAMRWCGPFAHANAYGFWLFPPVDLDVVWHGGSSFEHRFESLYTDDDASVVSRLQQTGDKYRYVPRKKVEFGSTLESVVSIWTGCIFQTPPGWGLMIRNPVNVTASTVFRAQEAILETDWLPYDIWINLLFVQQEKWARMRRNDGWPPLAQLLPVPKAAYDQRWPLSVGPLERTSAEGQDLFSRWIDYNHKKWIEGGRKEPATYHRQRRLAEKRSEETSSPNAIRSTER
jgi:hypothetical protein